jgi:hypothetical protein
MQRTITSVISLIYAVGVTVVLFAACRGEGTVIAQLPPPGINEPPPGSPPELPREFVELPPASANSPTRLLSQGDDLQRAIDSAVAGDVIALAPGAIFKGPITLPKKSGDGWITIRTKIPDGVFPMRGVRVDPSRASLMPIIESSSGSAITADEGAHHYCFVGIHVRPQPGTFLYTLIALGANETSVEDLPHHIVFERCYLHGDPKVGGRRGIALNSRYTAVVDSYLSDFKEQGADSQALCGWRGLGPFCIINNYLEGAGENVMFGGGDPTIINLVPSDIEVRHNHFSKPLTWRIGDPSYQGVPWTVKNLFELKNAQRVLIDGNVFEYNWLHSQNGFAILFTPRNQDGGAPWCTVRDITFTNNILRHSGSGMNVSGSDDNHPSEQTKRIRIANNIFVDINGSPWGGAGRLFQLLCGLADVTIEHNTAFQAGDVTYADGAPNTGFVFRNNLAPVNETGITGRGVVAQDALTQYYPGAVFVKNVLAGAKATSYPAENFFPPAFDALFVDAAAGNYRLKPNSSYKNAGTDGKDIGADIDAVEAALIGDARDSGPRRRAAGGK